MSQAMNPVEARHPFAEGLAHAVLRFQRCTACGAAQTLTRYVCGRCGATELVWQDAAGVGSVFSTTLVTRAPSDEFRALAPYTIALVDLDEGCRVMGLGAAGLAIGERVHARFTAQGARRLVIFHPGPPPTLESHNQEPTT